MDCSSPILLARTKWAQASKQASKLICDTLWRKSALCAEQASTGYCVSLSCNKYGQISSFAKGSENNSVTLCSRNLEYFPFSGDCQSLLLQPDSGGENISYFFHHFSHLPFDYGMFSGEASHLVYGNIAFSPVSNRKVKKFQKFSFSSLLSRSFCYDLMIIRSVVRYPEKGSPAEIITNKSGQLSRKGA